MLLSSANGLGGSFSVALLSRLGEGIARTFFASVTERNVGCSICGDGGGSGCGCLGGIVKYLQSDKIRIQRDTDKYTMQMPTQIHIQRQILVDACGCLWLRGSSGCGWLPVAAGIEWLPVVACGCLG